MSFHGRDKFVLPGRQMKSELWNDADTLFSLRKYGQTLILLHFSKNNRIKIDVTCGHFFFSDMAGWLYLWFNCYIFNPLLPFLSILNIFFIHKDWWNCEFSSMPSFFYKNYDVGEGVDCLSTGETQSDMLEYGWTYKSTFLLRKINVHSLCNLPIW